MAVSPVSRDLSRPESLAAALQELGVGVEDLPPDWYEFKSPKAKLYLCALAKYGKPGTAAKAVGSTTSTPAYWRRKYGRAFVEAEMEARRAAAALLEDAAWERAVEGMDRLKHDRDGNPLRDPDYCECGCARSRHDGLGRDGACLVEGCGCEGFVARTYREREYSDKLLVELLRAADPERFGSQRVEMRGLLASLDLSQLSDEQLERIAGGEHPASVLTGSTLLDPKKEVKEGGAR